MRLGLTSTGWIAFRKQHVFTVHFLKKGEGRSLCNQRVPYKHNFLALPRNAVICDKCRHMPGYNNKESYASPLDTRSKEGKAAGRSQQVLAA